MGRPICFMKKGCIIEEDEARSVVESYSLKGTGLPVDSVIKILRLKIQLGLESIGTIMDFKSKRYVSVDVMDIFVDSLNIWTIKKVGSKHLKVFVMTSGDTYQLSKLVQICI